MTITKTAFTGNTCVESGGACDFQVNDLLRLTIEESTFSENAAGNSGGALLVGSGSLIDFNLKQSMFLDNEAGGNGGAMFRNGVSFDEDLIANCTFSGNRAEGNGGGLQIQNSSTSLEIRHCTIVLNEADNDADFVGDGGGVFLLSSTPTVSHCLIAGNTRATSAGLTSPDLNGTVVTDGFNIVGDPSNATGFNFGAGGTDETFATLSVANLSEVIDPVAANNGGESLSHLPVMGGPAQEGGDTTAAPTGVGPDQRSFRRYVGPRRDIGAVELGTLPYTTWAAFEGLPAQLADFNVDGDKDGLPNGLEWKIGTDPLAPTANPIKNITVNPSSLTFDVIIATDFPLSLCDAEHSTDLGKTDPWSNTGVLKSVIETFGGGIRNVRFSIPTGLLAPPAVQARLKAHQN